MDLLNRANNLMAKFHAEAEAALGAKAPDELVGGQILECRYLVVKYTTYQGDPDGVWFDSFDDLDDAKLDVEEHLFPAEAGQFGIREDYENNAVVLDLDTGHEVSFSTVQEIRWLGQR